MKEIKFLAWEIPNGPMFEVAELSYKEDGLWARTPYDEKHQATAMKVGNSCELIQYTGLKDSYATEEYFDYIIEEEDGTRRVIEDGCSAVLFKNTKMEHDIKYFWQLGPHKVIGNIHQNPDLIA